MTGSTTSQNDGGVADRAAASLSNVQVYCADVRPLGRRAKVQMFPS